MSQIKIECVRSTSQSTTSRVRSSHALDNLESTNCRGGSRPFEMTGEKVEGGFGVKPRFLVFLTDNYLGRHGCWFSKSWCFNFFYLFSSLVYNDRINLLSTISFLHIFPLFCISIPATMALGKFNLAVHVAICW